MSDNIHIKQSPTGELLLTVPMTVPEGDLLVNADGRSVWLIADGKTIARADNIAPEIIHALHAQDGIWIIREKDGEPDMIPDPAHRAAIQSPAP